MDFNIDFDLVRSQKLLLIPQLKQALEILEMNSQELSRYIEYQLETNPVLEEPLSQALTETPEKTNFAETLEATLTLKEHLLIQLNWLCTDNLGHRIGEYLIDNIDDNGYLKVEIPEVATFFNVADSEVLQVLNKLQTLEPPGICARNLKECLLLQLDQLDDVDESARIVVEKYLEELASDDAEAVALLAGISLDKARMIFRKVKALEPRPGREFYDNVADNPAPPDIIIREMNGYFQVLTNEKAFPDICISESLTSKASVIDEAEATGYIHDKVKSAGWLIKSLEQRESIILSIAQKLCILEQKFLKNGYKDIILLDRNDFAALLEIHESILDKATKGKYLQCRWGTIELNSFFDEPNL